MSQIETWLQQWHDIVGSDCPFSEPNQLRGVLNDARWDDQTLEALFAPLPHGDAILARVRECTSCQAPDDRRPYVIPKALPATDAELIALATDALSRNKACGFTDDEGSIRVVRRTLTPGEWGEAAPLTEGLGDRFIQEVSAEAEFLRETVYGLTADNTVRDYILTPTYGAAIRRIDPYAPQFELWKRGASAVVTWGSLGEGVTVFVDP